MRSLQLSENYFSFLSLALIDRLTALPAAQSLHPSPRVPLCKSLGPVLQSDASCRHDIAGNGCQVLSASVNYSRSCYKASCHTPIHSSHFIRLNPIVTEYFLQYTKVIISTIISHHGNLRSISKRPIGNRFRCVNIPPWIRWCLWSLEMGRCPFCHVLSVIELV